MKHPEAGFVIKYFDLIDEFIRVRCCSDELLRELHRGPVTNKASYRNRVVHTCVPSYAPEVLPAVRKLDRECDEDIVEELLYQICIDVNPTLEIHQVAIPGNAAQGAPPSRTAGCCRCPQAMPSGRSSTVACRRSSAACTARSSARTRPSPPSPAQ